MSQNSPFRAKLTRLKSNHNNLRTDSVEGQCFLFPVVGKEFTITGKPLNPDADIRLVTTSPVKKIDHTEIGFEFSTEFSRYALEIFFN